MTPLGFPSALPFRRPPSPHRADRPLRYTWQPLGRSDVDAPLIPVALNERGDLLAYSSRPQRHEGDRHLHHGVHTHRGTIVRTAETENTVPFAALASNGLVAGATGGSYRELRAWASHLGTFGDDLWPDTVSLATGVNAAGLVVGQAYLEVGLLLLSRAFVVTPDGRGRFLTPPGGGTTVAAAINDDGDILLNATPLGALPGQTQAWVYRHGIYMPLGDLGSGHASVCALTAGGRTIGSSRTASGQHHAFLGENDHLIDLGTLPGWSCEPTDGNDHGTVVGRLTGARGERRAFHWRPERGMEILLDLAPEAAADGWVFDEAVAINAAGAIAVAGHHRGEPAGGILSPENPI